METTSLIPQLWGRKGLASPRDVMRRFFEDWETELFHPLEEGLGLAAPQMDVMEDEKEVKVMAELPGLEEKDIDLTLNKDHLMLKGEKKEEKEEKGKSFYRHERYFGSFRREVDLPCDVQTEKANAVFKNGLLTITIPKSQEALKETKKIPIKAA